MENHSSYAVAIIKPDAHRDVLAGMIVEDFEEEGFSVVLRKDIALSQTQAGKIYFNDHNQPNFVDATRSLMGTERDKFSTLLILKNKESEGGLLKAREVKGKVDSGGIRKKYNLYTKDELIKKGLAGEDLRNELSRNRLHVPDTDEEMFEIINLLLTEKERLELKDREPGLCGELIIFNEGREAKNEFLERKNQRPK